MNIRPAICIVENDKLLTMRYRYGNKDAYNLPGGNLEFGEKMADCLVRELKEELQINVAIGELLCLAEVFIKNKQSQTLHAIFKGEVKSGELILNPKETSALEIEWVPLEELSKIHLYPNVAEKLLLAIRGELPNPFLGPVEQPWLS